MVERPNQYRELDVCAAGVRPNPAGTAQNAGIRYDELSKWPRANNSGTISCNPPHGQIATDAGADSIVTLPNRGGVRVCSSGYKTAILKETPAARCGIQ